MAMSLHLRRKFPINLKNPNITTTTIHLFSSSSNTNPNEENSPPPPPPPQSPSPSPMSNYFSSLKSSLKNPSSQSSPPRKQPSFLSSPDNNASLQQVRKNLSQYRILNTASPSDNPQSSSSPPQSQSKPISFQDIYQRRNQEDANNSNNNKPVGFDNIRDTLKKLNIKGGSINGNRTSTKKDMFSLKDLRGDFATKPSGTPKSSVVAGVQIVQPSQQQRPNLNFSFGEKTRGGGGGSGEKSSAEGVVTNELIKIYRYEELGEKLRRLRPANAKPGQNWFSLSELNERLIKLREIDERESSQNIRGVNFSDMRESIQKMQSSDKEATEKRKKSTNQIQKLSFLVNLGGTPSYLLSPPNEELVEKYFHPDNMSSADKLKLELKKIRDEFKMSESDCGSSRVQVAQLTVKIKHLSSALHKKDKHSRKGLQEMVVRRKKLLKYLRRTDWDSYCFCLSKLGLRDNTDVSHTEKERVRKKTRERRSA